MLSRPYRSTFPLLVLLGITLACGAAEAPLSKKSDASASLVADEQESVPVRGLSPGITLRFARADWVRVTKARPGARVLYVFTDPLCPYCHRLWKDLQAHDSYGMEVRYLLVAVIDRSSRDLAAAILQAPDQAQALIEHEALLEKGKRIAPARDVSEATRETLSLHRAFMNWLGIYATPSLVFDGADGKASVLQGMPTREQLVAIAEGRL